MHLQNVTLSCVHSWHGLVKSLAAQCIKLIECSCNHGLVVRVQGFLRDKNALLLSPYPYFVMVTEMFHGQCQKSNGSK